MMTPSIYIIGSLKHERPAIIASLMRNHGFEVFDDWRSAGAEGDKHWREYEQHRGRSYLEALKGRACRNVLNFDMGNLRRCDGAMLVMPAGKSGHLELGFCVGLGKPTVILLQDPNPADWDCMVAMAGLVTDNVTEAANYFNKEFRRAPAPV